jgi:hypothetical protein
MKIMRSERKSIEKQEVLAAAQKHTYTGKFTKMKSSKSSNILF